MNKENKNSFLNKLKSLIKVDFRRMFTMPMFYIMAGIALLMPVLMLVMTSMMQPSGDVNTDTSGLMFTNVWQVISSVSGQGTMMELNINMLYFLIAVMVCIFIADDFKSGYSKNLFASRSNRLHYVASKTLVGFISGSIIIVVYFIGAMIGGAIANLSFDTGSAGVTGVIMCLISKIFLTLLFVSIFVIAGVASKQKLWLSIVLSLAISMLFYNMIPMISPLDSSFMNVILSLVGGVLFSIGIGTISNLLLNKRDIL